MQGILFLFNHFKWILVKFLMFECYLKVLASAPQLLENELLKVKGVVFVNITLNYYVLMINKMMMMMTRKMRTKCWNCQKFFYSEIKWHLWQKVCLGGLKKDHLQGFVVIFISLLGIFKFVSAVPPRKGRNSDTELHELYNGFF